MKIGIESELPVVDRQGVAASYPAVQAVFRHLVEQDNFEPYFDTLSGALLGAKRPQDGGTLDVGTDYGVCTLEVAFPPREGFASAQAAWNECLDSVLLPALASQRLSVLGYGCQPKTETLGRAYIAGKDHYELFATLVERYPSHYAFDAWPGFAALQFNVDVPLSQIVTSCNTLIKLSPLIWAWGANSSVFGGRIQPWLSLRVKGYTALAECNPFFAHRLHIPRRYYTSLADYMREAWSLPLFEIKRDGRIYYPVEEGLTTADFASAGQATFIDLGGEKATLSCTAADLATGLIFYWPAVRVKVRLDEGVAVADIVEAVAADRAESVLVDQGCGSFIEIRHLPSMARHEGFSWLAMFLAWLQDIEGCRALVEGWTLEEVRACTAEVLTRGWAARIQERPLREWGTAALDLAVGALAAKPVAPPEALAPLAQRLEHETCPAADAVRVVREHGIDTLIERLRLG
ncbi:MAG TPA: glutamate-cysteine ligase family protein [Pseudonocardiaceae bacterium]|nr:glutamate-cysteine ligase family protein [Pseudonocardiaceae bacterium]